MFQLQYAEIYVSVSGFALEWIEIEDDQAIQVMDFVSGFALEWIEI